VGSTPYTWNFGPTGSPWRKIADFEPKTQNGRFA